MHRTGRLSACAAGPYSWHGYRPEQQQGRYATGRRHRPSCRDCDRRVGHRYEQFEREQSEDVPHYRLTFQNAPADLIIWFYGTGTMNSIRIDHNKFANFATGAVAIFLGEVTSVAKFYGVIDHNTFSGPNNFMSLKYLGPLNPAQWSSSLKGTAQNIFR